jgi:hypothetical protein
VRCGTGWISSCDIVLRVGATDTMFCAFKASKKGTTVPCPKADRTVNVNVTGQPHGNVAIAIWPAGDHTGLPTVGGFLPAT